MSRYLGVSCARGFCEEVVVRESTLDLGATDEAPSHVEKSRTTLLHFTVGQKCLGS